MTENQKPERTFPIGPVIASVFLNETTQGYKFRSVTLQRKYNEGDQTRYANSFTVANLATARRALQLAHEYVEAKELYSPPS